MDGFGFWGKLQRRKHFFCGCNRLCNVIIAVRGADKTGFVQGGGDVDAAIQQAVEEFVEARAVCGHDFGVVLRQLVHQEKTKHAALAVAAEGHASIFRGLGQSCYQTLGFSSQFLKETGFLNLFQGRQAQAVATGLPDSVPAW